MMIKQPALAPSPQPRPAPTVRAPPAELAAQRGPFWMPIRGPNPTPIDILGLRRAVKAPIKPFGPLPLCKRSRIWRRIVEIRRPEAALLEGIRTFAIPSVRVAFMTTERD